ncbi:13701_t:CDS:2 [Racocetra fulgida]|uniref:13701_t:CDS:1 n=1 Tax=Racocetra fulgida TaxID=60492 RepID=A0A9N9FE83_9GLOM|nr:13701_t:CDS:2 [Racocetra fulgida]
MAKLEFKATAAIFLVLEYEIGEGSNPSSLRNDEQVDFSSKNESSFMNLLDESEEVEIFDDSSDENDESALKIYCGQTFQTWNNAEVFLKNYRLEQGFSIQKKCTESFLENGIQIVCKISWECSCAGKYKPKKTLNPEVQRDRKSQCNECEWRDMLDKEAEFAYIEEYKHQILTVGLATIPKTLFKSLDTIVSKYLMDSISVHIHLDDNVNDEAREDDYELAQSLLTDILETIETSDILEIWHNKIGDDQDILKQHNPISLCVELPLNGYITTNYTFNLEHIMKFWGGDLYTPALQNVNNARSRYGYIYGLMKKTIDVGINTNSYDELIGMCQQFLSNKQSNNDDHAKEILITNPMISPRKGRPSGRAKSSIELQELQTRKHRCLSNNDDSIQLPANNDNKNLQSSKPIHDNRRRCQRCGQKGHNRAICKAENV